MEIPESLQTNLRAKQQGWDEEKAVKDEQEATHQTERQKQQMVDRTVRAMERITEKAASYTGSQAYLGRDALVRDYHSAWLQVSNDIADPTAVPEFQLERVYRIKRTSGIETHAPFEKAEVSLRLHDTMRSIVSREEVSLVFSVNTGILLKKDGELTPVTPDSPEWSDVMETVTAIATATETTNLLPQHLQPEAVQV